MQRARELQFRLRVDEATDAGLVQEFIMIRHALNKKMQAERLREVAGRKKAAGTRAIARSRARSLVVE